jgi:predicted  nucleic acid-binding Zn-ribbon protein
LKAARERDAKNIQILQQRLSNGNNGHSNSLSVSVTPTSDEIASLKSELASAVTERQLAERAAVVLQQALTALEKDLKAAQTSEQQKQDEITQLRAQLQLATAAARPTHPQLQLPAQQFVPPTGPPSHVFANGPQQHRPTAAVSLPYIPPTSSPTTFNQQPPPHMQSQLTHPGVTRPMPILPFHSHPPVQPPPAQSFQYHPQQQQYHPAVAELQILQTKYDGLKNDYNLLVDKYDAQKVNLRHSNDTLTSSQTEQTRLTNEIARLSHSLKECESALERSQRHLTDEQERSRLESVRLKSNARSLADSLERLRDKTTADSKRNAQLQKIVNQQLDSLLEEKGQLTAQLHTLTNESDGDKVKTARIITTSKSDHVKQQQNDLFSDELSSSLAVKLEPTVVTAAVESNSSEEQPEEGEITS